jgi:hypothetical protein
MYSAFDFLNTLTRAAQDSQIPSHWHLVLLKKRKHSFWSGCYGKPRSGSMQGKTEGKKSRELISLHIRGMCLEGSELRKFEKADNIARGSRVLVPVMFPV